jgi:hypothetical protein
MDVRVTEETPGVLSLGERGKVEGLPALVVLVMVRLEVDLQVALLGEELLADVALEGLDP